jgi:hypothetical protein
MFWIAASSPLAVGSNLAGYATAISLANQFGNTKVVSLLSQTLTEEEAADEKLRKIGQQLLKQLRSRRCLRAAIEPAISSITACIVLVGRLALTRTMAKPSSRIRIYSKAEGSHDLLKRERLQNALNKSAPYYFFSVPAVQLSFWKSLGASVSPSKLFPVRLVGLTSQVCCASDLSKCSFEFFSQEFCFCARVSFPRAVPRLRDGLVIELLKRRWREMQSSPVRCQ